MNKPSDETIEALLRKQFDGPVRDQGFSDRVMLRLPPRRRRAIWPLWVGVLAGMVACWLALWSSPLLHAAWHDWMRGDWSVSAIAVLAAVCGMALLALTWVVAEAGDH